jgi:hypothetical protein
MVDYLDVYVARADAERARVLAATTPPSRSPSASRAG